MKLGRSSNLDFRRSREDQKLLREDPKHYFIEKIVKYYDPKRYEEWKKNV